MYIRASRISGLGLTAPSELSNWYGEPVPVRAPDSIGRIVGRGFELIQNPDQFGIKITTYQQQRIRCILGLLRKPDTDDRFLTYQSVLDWTNNLVENPYFSSAKEWLLPQYEIKSGHQVTDQEIRHRLVVNIDWQIIYCRDQVKRRYAQQGEATPRKVQLANTWMANQQNNPRSIYWCYRP
jgi:hypothetical protein